MDYSQACFGDKGRKSLKHSKAVCPDSLQQNYGYHHQFYCFFVVVGKVYQGWVWYREKERKEKNNKISGCIKFSKLCWNIQNSVLTLPKVSKNKSKVEQKLIRAEARGHQGTENKIPEHATWLEDNNMLRAISDINFVAKKVYYQSICRKNYEN